MLDKQLAWCRYPDLSPALALDCYLYDRRRAGLGALDEQLRGRKRNGVYRYKYADRRGTTYVLGVRHMAHRKAKQLDEFRMTSIFVPEVNLAVQVVASPMDSRDTVARMLWQARHELQRAISASRNA